MVQKRYKSIVIIALVVSILGLSAAFMAISSNLNIIRIRNLAGYNDYTGQGEATAESQGNYSGEAIGPSGATNKGSNKNYKYKWNIHFANEDEGIVYGNADKGTINLESTKVVISDIKLNSPGDQIVYTFDIVNSGNLNAKIDGIVDITPSFTGTGSQKESDEDIVKNNIVYSLTYKDGSPIKKGDVLNAKKKVRVKATITYSNAESGPNDPVVIADLGTVINYIQK